MNQKVMHLTVIGTGESLLRIQKRLSCAAAELGITLQVGIDKSPEAWGLTYVQTPAVMAQGKCLLTGLKRTEDIVTILAGDVIDRVPSLGSRAAYAKQYLRDKLLDHKAYIEKQGEDMPEIRDWKWEG